MGNQTPIFRENKTINKNSKAGNELVMLRKRQQCRKKARKC